MCQLLESIQICQRIPQNIEFHNLRFNKSRKELFGISQTLDLQEVIKIPDSLGTQTYKCRILYEKQIKRIDFEEYTPKKIRFLKIVESNIDYAYKFADRSELNKLLSENLENPKESDLILVKNNKITDSTFSNLAFFDGKNWFTPNFPLLEGTHRAKLIQEKKIIPINIFVKDLHFFEKIALINALRPLENTEYFTLDKVI
ncbi:MAG: hypothetical protein EAZ97_07685 [Bacteroidetes bacterium]|nr:MAG: hypothetical protein EAZ97_07685 [Bacteroidota bacterium]